MDYQALKTLIMTHPSWPSVTDADLVTWANDKVITKEHATLSSGTILSTILSYTAEWTPISDANKQLVRDILYTYSGEGIPTAAGTPARTALVAILGANTKAAIAAAISYNISRAENIGIIQEIAIWHIEEARRLAGV